MPNKICLLRWGVYDLVTCWIKNYENPAGWTQSQGRMRTIANQPHCFIEDKVTTKQFLYCFLEKGEIAPLAVSEERSKRGALQHTQLHGMHFFMVIPLS